MLIHREWLTKRNQIKILILTQRNKLIKIQLIKRLKPMKTKSNQLAMMIMMIKRYQLLVSIEGAHSMERVTPKLKIKMKSKKSIMNRKWPLKKKQRTLKAWKFQMLKYSYHQPRLINTRCHKIPHMKFQGHSRKLIRMIWSQKEFLLINKKLRNDLKD